MPEVSKENFPDLGVAERNILKDLQNITSKLEDKGYFNDSIDWVIRSLERMIEG